jgi:hypothetical protein
MIRNVKFAALMGALVITMASSQVPSYTPKDGFVPDEETAVRVAEAILAPIYGQGNIDRQKPLKAVFKDGVWTVTGTLPSGKVGGVAVIEISKADARVNRVSHGR